ncbi:MAG TPA: ABC transporter ATP-binding protein [Candidatus Limnocylindrales bacterium]|nr:ABC transporter ATP-binding protein [Candidatus Limnocylindrales bacterium]
MTGSGVLLSVENLTTEYRTAGGGVPAVQDVSFQVHRGEIFGLVGESGSGKSTVIRSIIGLLPKPAARITRGTVRLDGLDLISLDPREMRRIRGGRVAMVFQDPMTSLDPVLPIGDQIREGLRYHGITGRAAQARVLEVMSLVGIPDAPRRQRAYPFELSGGLRQRVAIAIALAASPQVLLADEPTTALDVTIQDQILKLLLSLKEQLGMSVLLVTHDLGVVAQTCQRVAVMYAGRLVEIGPVTTVFSAPAHPYTRGLLASLPGLATGRTRLRAIPGSPPDLGSLPSGCAFRTRCPIAIERCAEVVPPLEDHGTDHLTACLRHQELGQTDD